MLYEASGKEPFFPKIDARTIQGNCEHGKVNLLSFFVYQTIRWMLNQVVNSMEPERVNSISVVRGLGPLLSILRCPIEL